MELEIGKGKTIAIAKMTGRQIWSCSGMPEEVSGIATDAKSLLMISPEFYYSYGSEVSSIAPDLEADAANAGPSTLRPSRPASRPPIAFEPGISAGPSQTAVLDCSACGTTLEYLKYTCQVCGEGGAGGYQLCAGCIEVHGIGHARTAVAQASAAGRTELRHTFVEKIWSDTGWKDVGAYQSMFPTATRLLMSGRVL